MEAVQTSKPLLWPAVDVGGTTIRLLLVADPRHQMPSPPIRIEVSTRPGLTALAETLRTCIRDATEIATGRGYQVANALAIGTPGRLEIGTDGRRVIAPRTAMHNEAYAGELDGVDLAGELADALGLPRSRVFWDNDAVVQGRHLIGELLREPEAGSRLRGHVVVCINPGTGLGGCVARVDDDSIEVFTDGHISELLIHPVELSADLGPVAVTARSTVDGSSIEIDARSGGSAATERLSSPDAKQAENFIAGSGLERIANVVEKCCSRLEQPVRCFAYVNRTVDGRAMSDLIGADQDTTAARAARFIADLGGLAVARLMTVLHDGSARKSAPFPDWSPTDLDRLRGVTRFVFGGGIRRTPLGQHIIKKATSQLAHWPALELFEREQIADAGALGAFSLIPEETLRAVEEETNRAGFP